MQQRHTLSPPQFLITRTSTQVLQELKMYEQAKDIAAKAVQLAPHWSDAHLTYARACLNCGALQQAVQGFNRARVRSEFA